MLKYASSQKGLGISLGESVCVQTRVAKWQALGGQRTTSASWLFLSSMWAMWMELRPPSLFLLCPLIKLLILSFILSHVTVFSTY